MEVEDAELFRREDYYFAQLACEMRRSWVKNPKKVKVEDFLIKFTGESISSKASAQTTEGKMQQSKQFWLGNILRRKKKKNKKPKKRKR
jgi:hypothetical protein